MICVGPWKFKNHEWIRKVLTAKVNGYPHKYSVWRIGDRFAASGFLFSIGTYFDTIEQAKAAIDETLEKRGYISIDEERFARLEMLL